MADLWAEVYKALSYQKWKEKGDTDPQSVLNRAADKCIRGYESPAFNHATCRSFDRSNCEVEEKHFPLSELLKAKRYPHAVERAKAHRSANYSLDGRRPALGH
jgi:hypothetical protein